MTNLRTILTFWLIISTAHAATWVSDGSRADVQAKIDSASDGDTVTAPAGTFNWSSAIIIAGKGIILQGAGAGRYEGYSVTSLAIGTGSKTFTTQSGMSWQASDAIVVYSRTAGNANTMVGTVTTYSGTTLEINVTSVTGSGTFPQWVFGSPAQTIIVNDQNGALVQVAKDSTHVGRVNGFHFTQGSGTGFNHILASGSGRPVIIESNKFSSSGGADRHIELQCNGAIVAGNSFDNGFNVNLATGQSNDDQGIGVKFSGGNSWSSASLMGTLDTDGEGNGYIEDNWFSLHNTCIDIDDNGRYVIRNNKFDHCSAGTHGLDTSDIGVRYVELYDNDFYFENIGGGNTFPVNFWWFNRGGTGIIYNNRMPDINSTEWGNKAEIIQMMQVIRRSTQHPDPGRSCTAEADNDTITSTSHGFVDNDRISTADDNLPGGITAGASGQLYYIIGATTHTFQISTTQGGSAVNITSDGGTFWVCEYPQSHQIGWGHNGSADVLEPMYVWGNTGSPPVNVNDYTPDDLGHDLTTSMIVQAGREFFNDGTAKPGWVAFEYPHPLLDDAPEPPVGGPTWNIGTARITTLRIGP